MKQAPDQIDYEGDDLDDVVISDVALFRLEYMADNNIWIKLYREGKPDLVFWLTARGKIKGHHHEE